MLTTHTDIYPEQRHHNQAVEPPTWYIITPPFTLAELTPYQIQSYYADKLRDGLSAYTVIYQHRLLRQVLKHAVQWRLLPYNPTDGATPSLSVG